MRLASSSKTRLLIDTAIEVHFFFSGARLAACTGRRSQRESPGWLILWPGKRQGLYHARLGERPPSSSACLVKVVTFLIQRLQHRNMLFRPAPHVKGQSSHGLVSVITCNLLAEDTWGCDAALAVGLLLHQQPTSVRPHASAVLESTSPPP